jgi:hypothetical protein
MNIKKLHLRTYTSWSTMRNRCLNPNRWDHKYYYDKGITICERWLSSFLNFLEDMGERPEETSLDRIDSTKGYCKENCRWATKKQQQRNLKTNRTLTYKGETKTIAEWVEITGLHRDTLTQRIDSGWEEKDLFIPLVKRNQYTNLRASAKLKSGRS